MRAFCCILTAVVGPLLRWRAPPRSSVAECIASVFSPRSEFGGYLGGELPSPDAGVMRALDPTPSFGFVRDPIFDAQRRGFLGVTKRCKCIGGDAGGVLGPRMVRAGGRVMVCESSLREI